MKRDIVIAIAIIIMNIIAGTVGHMAGKYYIEQKDKQWKTFTEH